jgi:hypothetical protein
MLCFLQKKYVHPKHDGDQNNQDLKFMNNDLCILPHTNNYSKRDTRPLWIRGTTFIAKLIVRSCSKSIEKLYGFFVSHLINTKLITEEELRRQNLSQSSSTKARFLLFSRAVTNKKYG